MSTTANSSQAYEPSNGAKFLDVKNLSKAYGEVEAVRGISFAVPRGQAIGLIGESGSGKSTVARLLVGLEEPDTGTVSIDGRQLGRKRAREDRRAIQIIFQDSLAALNPRLTILESVEDFLAIHGLKNRRARRLAALEALATVYLSESVASRRPAELSGGQRQRACIARALALNPSVLVADEPTSALDVSIQGQILNLIVELKSSREMTLVFITHDMSVVRYVADEIVVMLQGEVVEHGQKETLTISPQHSYTQRLLDAIDLDV
jgi:ABC-type glutathione transport system ATPase component